MSTPYSPGLKKSLEMNIVVIAKIININNQKN